MTASDHCPAARDGLATLLIVLLAAMPVAIMTSQAWPSPIFYATMLVALAILLRTPRATVAALLRSGRTLFICMAAPALVTLGVGLWHGRVPGADLESSLRLVMGAALVCLALLARPQADARQALWGYAVAAVAAAGFIVMQSWPDWHRPDTTAVYNAVGYGNLTLLLSVLLALSIKWTLTARPHAERGLRAGLALIALAAFVLTQTRSGWVAMPVFAFIGAGLAAPAPAGNGVAVDTVVDTVVGTAAQRGRWRLFLLAGLIMAALLAVFLSNTTLRDRAVLAWNETLECRNEQATADTSICIRLQLWRAALQAGAEHPIAGLGDRRHFARYLHDQARPGGLVSETVAEGWGEPHNDVLLALASFGIPGALALLLAFMAPAVVFARRMGRRHCASIRTAAAMGLALCLGFLIFGFTETMLRGMRTAAYFAMSCGLFLALSDPLRRRGAATPALWPGKKDAGKTHPSTERDRDDASASRYPESENQGNRAGRRVK